MIFWALIVAVLVKGSPLPVAVMKVYPTKEFCEAVAKEMTNVIIEEEPRQMSAKCFEIRLGDPA